jgi:hypothetical protein
MLENAAVDVKLKMPDIGGRSRNPLNGDGVRICWHFPGREEMPCMYIWLDLHLLYTVI